MTLKIIEWLLIKSGCFRAWYEHRLRALLFDLDIFSLEGGDIKTKYLEEYKRLVKLNIQKKAKSNLFSSRVAVVVVVFVFWLAFLIILKIK